MITSAKIRELATQLADRDFDRNEVDHANCMADYTDGFHAALALVREIVTGIQDEDHYDRMLKHRGDPHYAMYGQLRHNTCAEILGALEVGESE